MSRPTRRIALCLVVGAALASPISLAAAEPAAAGGLSAGEVCSIVGGAVTLGFGLWHFAVPGIYQWWSYVPDAPSTLVDAVDATNFFFSASLSLVGATSIAMPFLTQPADPANQAWLWANVGLWTARVVYQLVRPQGSFSPALQWGMLAAFAAVDGLFITSAILASSP